MVFLKVFLKAKIRSHLFRYLFYLNSPENHNTDLNLEHSRTHSRICLRLSTFIHSAFGLFSTRVMFYMGTRILDSHWEPHNFPETSLFFQFAKKNQFYDILWAQHTLELVNGSCLLSKMTCRIPDTDGWI